VTGLQALGLLVTYLLGGIPVGLLVGLARGVDVRQVGSGNIGATNVMRGVGPALGLLVFAIDVLKGVAGVMVGRQLGMDGWLLGMAALFVMLGHSFSPYMAFKGGKGVATTLGAGLGLSPVAALIAFGIWFAVVLPTRYVSLASIVGTAALAVLVYVFAPAEPEMAVPVAAMAIIVIGRHSENIERLLKGEESRFGSPRGNGPGAPKNEAQSDEQ